jgi:protein gp37
MPTEISWTDETWNPTTGCDRVSPGCDHCYALTMAARLKAMGQPRYQNDGDPRTSGPGFGLTVHPGALRKPLSWRKARRVFVNSMSDLFHPDVPSAFIVEVFARMALTRRHTFQVLTKRPKFMATMLSHPDFPKRVAKAATEVIGHTSSYERRSIEFGPDSLTGYGTDFTTGWTVEPRGDGNRWHPPWPLPNVWLGTSIESDRYTFRANHLRQTPAAVRFLSCEPLLGPLPSLDLTSINWVIIGGESGHGARSMENDWAHEIVCYCRAVGVACFVKQLSGRGGRAIHDIELFPPSLQIREFPDAP